MFQIGGHKNCMCSHVSVLHRMCVSVSEWPWWLTLHQAFVARIVLAKNMLRSLSLAGRCPCALIHTRTSSFLSTHFNLVPQRYASCRY